MKTITMKNCSISPYEMHRAIQIGLALRTAREKHIILPEDYFEKMPTEDVEKWRGENEQY